MLKVNPCFVYRGVCFAMIMASMLCVQCLAQIESSNRPVKWERYRDAEDKIAVDMPKPPVRIITSNMCSGRVNTGFYAYAEGVVYELTVVTKQEDLSNLCVGRTRPFDQTAFEARVKQLGEAPEAKTSYVDGPGIRTTYKITSPYSNTWVVNDLRKQRWIEMSVHFRKGFHGDPTRFVKSLDLDPSDSGTIIGEGSDRILGDEEARFAAILGVLAESVTGNDSNKVPISEGVRIIAKANAHFTAGARIKLEGGTVLLRVTFLSNGGVGAISVVSGLKYGLTDEAVAAARKIVFLPARSGDLRVSVTKQVEYSFVIY
jgi:TonB family protein